VALAAVATVLVAVLIAPVRSDATDSDLKHAYAFKLKASNGYSILAFAGSERADGRGQFVMFVGNRTGFASYVARATVTATRIEADLGRLGQVALNVMPSGRKTSVRSSCQEEPESFSFEPQVFSGSFEFHGEEGYAEAATTSPREYTRFFIDLVCSGTGSGETGGPGLPGAGLRLHSHQGSFRLNLQVNKNHPGAHTRFAVEAHEKRQGVVISRGTTLWAGAGAFGYDPLLRTATLVPPAPFSGHADFNRGAIAANRWTGNLTVDLPGRSNVPLTGAGVGATLAHACWHEGEDPFRC
jgi:hypothetical protein